MARKKESVRGLQKRLKSVRKMGAALKRLEKARSRIGPFAPPRTYIATKVSETWVANPGASSPQYPSQTSDAHNAEVEKAAYAFGERNREALTELAKW